MLPKGAISSVEELKEIDRRAKAGEKIKIYWASTHSKKLRHDIATGRGVEVVRGGFSISTEMLDLIARLPHSHEEDGPSYILFTNYWYAYAWAQKINKKKEAA